MTESYSYTLTQGQRAAHRTRGTCAAKNVRKWTIISSWANHFSVAASQLSSHHHKDSVLSQLGSARQRTCANLLPHQEVFVAEIDQAMKMSASVAFIIQGSEPGSTRLSRPIKWSQIRGCTSWIGNITQALRALYSAVRNRVSVRTSKAANCCTIS